MEIPYVVPSFAASSSASVPVRLSVYNLQGQLVRTLVNGPIAAGSHVARWDGRNGGGRQVGNGLYFLRLSVGNEGAVATSRIIRLR
jgi:flagellar hook assembly protein FlgD